jgi:hypothetical protein
MVFENNVFKKEATVQSEKLTESIIPVASTGCVDSIPSEILFSKITYYLTPVFKEWKTLENYLRDILLTFSTQADLAKRSQLISSFVNVLGRLKNKNLLLNKHKTTFALLEVLKDTKIVDLLGSIGDKDSDKFNLEYLQFLIRILEKCDCFLLKEDWHIIFQNLQAVQLVNQLLCSFMGRLNQAAISSLIRAMPQLARDNKALFILGNANFTLDEANTLLLKPEDNTAVSELIQYLKEDGYFNLCNKDILLSLLNNAQGGYALQLLRKLNDNACEPINHCYRIAPHAEYAARLVEACDLLYEKGQFTLENFLQLITALETFSKFLVHNQEDCLNCLFQQPLFANRVMEAYKTLHKESRLTQENKACVLKYPEQAVAIATMLSRVRDGYQEGIRQHALYAKELLQAYEIFFQDRQQPDEENLVYWQEICLCPVYSPFVANIYKMLDQIDQLTEADRQDIICHLVEADQIEQVYCVLHQAAGLDSRENREIFFVGGGKYLGALARATESFVESPIFTACASSNKAAVLAKYLQVLKTCPDRADTIFNALNTLPEKMWSQSKYHELNICLLDIIGRYPEQALYIANVASILFDSKQYNAENWQKFMQKRECIVDIASNMQKFLEKKIKAEQFTALCEEVQLQSPVKWYHPTADSFFSGRGKAALKNTSHVRHHSVGNPHQPRTPALQRRRGSEDLRGKNRPVILASDNNIILDLRSESPPPLMINSLPELSTSVGIFGSCPRNNTGKSSTGSSRQGSSSHPSQEEKERFILIPRSYDKAEL